MGEKTEPSKIAKNLHCYSVQDLEEGYSLQNREYDWNFSHEREFVENLFCQRFNFLLVIYSLFITAAASTESQTTLIIILFLGAFLSFLVSLTIWRIYAKLIVNLRIIHRLPKHPFEFIQKETDALGWRGLFQVNFIIGKIVPIFCTISLALGFILACLGIVNADC
ncbi:MAG: hypothetical protein V1913_10280 [Fibrobacterota bacterium]